MSGRFRRLRVWSGVVFCLLLLAGGWVLYQRYWQGPPAPLPVPNGYDDLVRAGQRVGGAFRDWRQLTPEELKAAISSHAEAFRVLRIGLARECRLPVEKAIANFANGSADLTALKSLAQLLSAEGRLAEWENRPGDAARSYVDAIRLGHQSSRGGMFIHRLVGIACEQMGMEPLVKMMPRLDDAQRAALGVELENLSRTAPDWSEMLESENRFARSQIGTYGNPFRFVVDLWQMRGPRQSIKEKHLTAVARLRVLTAEMALCQHALEQGKTPGNLEELVPKYLRGVPADPFTERPILFRPSVTNWVVYSVGPDGVDDGGKPIDRNPGRTRAVGAEDDESAAKRDRGDIRFDAR